MWCVCVCRLLFLGGCRTISLLIAEPVHGSARWDLLLRLALTPSLAATDELSTATDATAAAQPKDLVAEKVSILFSSHRSPCFHSWLRFVTNLAASCGQMQRPSVMLKARLGQVFAFVPFPSR